MTVRYYPNSIDQRGAFLSLYAVARNLHLGRRGYFRPGRRKPVLMGDRDAYIVIGGQIFRSLLHILQLLSFL
jgi:hypothetical protein